MSGSSIYRQLILFDCDDGRLSLFKDHKQYLRQIPSNCECYIFWNDHKLPVYKKLSCILNKYSCIRLCPSYRQQTNDSSDSYLLFILNKLICEFSFVLLVHGDDQSYASVFKRVVKQYGHDKMKLKAINKPFSHHLLHILTRLQQKNSEYSYPKYIKILSSKDQLKHKGQSSSSNSIFNYDNSCIPYGLEENTDFRCLIKRKQKSLKNYFSNARLCKTTSFVEESDVEDQFEQDYEDYLSTMHVQLENSEIQVSTTQMLLLSLQYRRGQTYTVVVARYFRENLRNLVCLSVFNHRVLLST